MVAQTDYEYSDYVAAGCSEIPEAEYAKYRNKAWRVLKAATNDKVETATAAFDLAKIPLALYEVADAIYNNEQGAGGIANEKIGTYSVAYKLEPVDPYKVAYVALSGTVIAYCGLSVPAYGAVDLD